MKAAYYYDIGKIGVEEVDIPAIGEDEMLLKVKLACICGTDQRIYKNGHFKIAPGEKRVLGHELAGELVDIGNRVNGYSVGDRVSVVPNIGCGHCAMCAGGLNHMCADYKAFGISYDGGFEEYMRIPADAVQRGNIIRLPDAVSYEQAVITEPFSCCFNSFEMLQTRPTDTVLIIGAGPIGVMHAILHRRAGAAKVLVADLSVERLEQLRAFGDFILVDTSKQDLAETLLQETNGHGADIVITACSVSSVQTQALELTASLGRVCFFGGLPEGKETVSLNTNLIHYKELRVMASTGSSVRQYVDTMHLITSGEVDVSQLITARYPIDKIQEAFDYSLSAAGLKTAIVFD